MEGLPHDPSEKMEATEIRPTLTTWYAGEAKTIPNWKSIVHYLNPAATYPVSLFSRENWPVKSS